MRTTTARKILEIKHSEQKLLKAVEELRKAIERSGSMFGMSEVDDEVVSLQTRLLTFKQGCRIFLQSDAGSVASKQKSFRRASSRASSSSSSRAKLAKAEMEKRKAQERYLKETDDLAAEQEKEDAERRAEQAKEDAERLAQQAKEDAERRANQEKKDAERAKKDAERLARTKQLERLGEIAGLDAEIRTLEMEDGGDADALEETSGEPREPLLRASIKVNQEHPSMEAWRCSITNEK